MVNHYFYYMEKQQSKDWIGKKVPIWLASNKKRPYIVKVMEVNEEGRAIKFRASRRQESLAKKGFIQEGDQWIIMEWQVCRN